MTVKITLPTNDPNKVDIKSIIKKEQVAEQKRLDELAAQKRKKELREKHKDILLNMPSLLDDKMQFLFDALVPDTGMAETVAGEIVRSIERIRYRDYQDGDIFYEGYGLETCGSSIEYIAEIIDVEKFIIEIAETQYRDDMYTKKLNELAEMCVNFIVDNPETLETENKIDSRNRNIEWIEDYQPRYEYSFELPDNIAAFVEKECIDAWEIQSMIEDMMNCWNCFEGAEVDTPWGHYSTDISISNLLLDGYNMIQEWKLYEDDAWKYQVEELTEKYGSMEDEDE